MRNENWRRTLRHATDELTPIHFSPSLFSSHSPSLSLSFSLCPISCLSRQNQFGFAVFVHSQPAAAEAVVQFAGLPHVAAPAATAGTAAHPGQLHFSLNTSKRITKRQQKLPLILSERSSFFEVFNGIFGPGKVANVSAKFQPFFYASQTIICSCHLPLATVLATPRISCY